MSLVGHCLPERSETEVSRSRVPHGTDLASQFPNCLNSDLQEGRLVLATPTLSGPSTFSPAKDWIASVARFLAGTGTVEFSKSGPLRNDSIVQQGLPVFKGVDWFQHGQCPDEGLTPEIPSPEGRGFTARFGKWMF
jgi:hypothetical protein